MFHTKACWVEGLHTLGVYENVLEIKINSQISNSLKTVFQARKERQRTLENGEYNQNMQAFFPTSILPPPCC